MISESEEFPSNASMQINSSVSGRWSSLRLQSANADGPISVSFFGNVILESEVQFAKRPPFITSIPSGSLTSVNASQETNEISGGFKVDSSLFDEEKSDET